MSIDDAIGLAALALAVAIGVLLMLKAGVIG